MPGPRFLFGPQNVRGALHKFSFCRWITLGGQGILLGTGCLSLPRPGAAFMLGPRLGYVYACTQRSDIGANVPCVSVPPPHLPLGRL